MKHMRERMTALLLCLSLLAGFILVLPPTKVEAAGEKTTFTEYATLAKVYEQDGCYSMQGMAVHENYIYACKTNNGTDTMAVVARINIHDGSKVFLTNASTGTYVFEDFVHGNEIEVERIGGKVTMFIPTMASGSESLIRYTISGTTATRVGNYTMTYNGSNIAGGAIRVMHYSENYITFIFKSGNSFYTGTIPVSQYSGTVEMSLLFNFNYTTLYYDGVARDMTGFSLQGFEYYDGRIYLPLSGHAVSGMVNVSVIQVYDIQGITAGCTLDPERNLSFYFDSQEYPAYFEIESCGISPRTGKMYFNTNSRVSSTSTNHDGVHYCTDWEYEPTQRNTDVNNYRWEVIGDKLTSVSTNGSALNHAIMLQGSVSGGQFTLCRYATDRTVVLEHDRPWEVEWKASNVSSGSMLFASEGDCANPDITYIYRRGDKSVIAMGTYDGKNNHDYGVDLSPYGIDESQTHVYRLSNRINADGSNMVYLSVDGVELGAMNNYYVDGYDQGATSNWISGRDFRFSYFGPYNYRLDSIKLSYIQVWGNGEDYKPDGIYRWETKNGTMSAVMGNSIPTLNWGSVSGSTHSTTQHSLSQGVTLMHDQPWTIQWKGAGSGGGGTILGSDNRGDCTNARYIMRNGNVIFFGYRDGTNHQQYGINPTDYGVDMSQEHLFTLQNKVSADGSNMVYLSVDGEELGAMTQYYKNGGNQGSTSQWVNGKDFAFNWIGTLPYSLNKQSLSYLQIWENGIVEGDVANSYRWETVNDSMTSLTTDGYTANTPNLRSGSISGGIYSSASYILDHTVVLRHDRNWQIQWQSDGSTAGSGMLLSSSSEGDETNNLYLFRNANGISIGTYTGSRHEQWGVSVVNNGIDFTVPHIYALKNVLNADGTNTVWLCLDGKQLAPMTEHFVYGSVTSDPASNWLSGKDMTFNYIGAAQFPVNNMPMSYLMIDEGCSHNYGEWSVTSATCIQEGKKIRTCSICGDQEVQILPATGHSYNSTVTAPTCTNGGYTTYRCGACGDTYQANATEATGHSYTSSKTESPTCTEPGLRTLTCGSCGHAKTEVIPAAGHDYKATVIEPTCVTSGYTTYRCSDCGDVYQDNNTPATGHSYQTVTTPPSCTDQGYTTFTCQECGSSYIGNYTDAVGHSYSSKVTAPTCTAGGYTTYTCTDCGHSYKDQITNSTGHNYKTTVVEPTCVNGGYTVYTCVCGDTYTANQTAATGHSYKTVTVDATCTAAGSITETCSACGDKKVQTIPATGHGYNAVVTDPTCTENGYTTYTCTGCGQSYKDQITNPTGHNYKSTVVEPTCVNGGYTVYACVCGDTYTANQTAATGHSYKTVTVDATCTAAGSITETCSACGDKKVQTIPATGHGYNAVVTDPTCTENGYTTYTCHCGDSYVADQVTALGHSFADGICTVCGAADPDYNPAVVQPTLTLKAPALEFKDMVKVIAFFTAENIEDVVEMGMITYSSKVDSWSIETAENVIPGATYDAGSGRYFASSQGIHAKYLGDTVYLSIYAKLSDGSYTYTRLVSYSPVTYATNQLTNSTNTSLKQLVAAMLNYGAAAQNYFGYNTDVLANSAMTAEQLALPESYTSDMVQSVPAADAAKQGVFANNKGFSARKPAVSFEGAFSINYFFTPAYTPVNGITLYYWTEADFNAVDILTVDNATGALTMTAETDGQYRGDITGIAAKNIAQAVYVAAVYSDGTTMWTSGVLGYSIGAYCASMAKGTDAMADLAKATAVYGYHAKQYFG